MMKLKLLGSKNQPLFGRRDQASLPREGSEGGGGLEKAAETNGA